MMNPEFHLYIISYDLDSYSDDNQKSKRLISFLRQHNAVCLTKSTWLLATPDSCSKVYCAISNVFGGSTDGAPNIFDLISSHDCDRLFVSEITGPVFYERLICEDATSQHIPLEVLLDACPHVYDGFNGPAKDND